MGIYERSEFKGCFLFIFCSSCKKTVKKLACPDCAFMVTFTVLVNSFTNTKGFASKGYRQYQLDLLSDLSLLMKGLVKVMWSLYWQRIIGIPFQSLAAGSHELSTDARKVSQNLQIPLYRLLFCYKWTAPVYNMIY